MKNKKSVIITDFSLKQINKIPGPLKDVQDKSADTRTNDDCNEQEENPCFLCTSFTDDWFKVYTQHHFPCYVDEN
jgi:hypothetical protein